MVIAAVYGAYHETATFISFHPLLTSNKSKMPEK